MELPLLVISKIHYHPMDAEPFNGNQLEFIQIDNNSDDDIDLSGIYLRELGITYNFPNGSHLAARDALVLCSDSLAYIQYYNKFPFGEYQRKLSNKSEKIVLADAWGNVIDEVHYSDSEPWPTEPDGNGPYLKLIDLELDNSLAENWTYSTEYDNADEISYNKLAVFPNPANGMLNIVTKKHIISTEIIDLYGRIIARFSDNTINVSTLPNGYYNIRITTDEEVVVSKVCVIH